MSRRVKAFVGYWRMFGAVLGLAGLITIGVSVLLPHAAPRVQAAAGCGVAANLPCDTNYFSGQSSQVGAYLYDTGLNVSDTGALINFMNSKLQCSNPGAPNAKVGSSSSNDTAAAAYIVLTMLGQPAGTSKDQACVRINDWQDRVNEYGAAGLIHWNESYISCLGSQLDDVAHDINTYNDLCESTAAIVFYSPGGAKIYAIRRVCGNPSGLLGALTPLSGGGSPSPSPSPGPSPAPAPPPPPPAPGTTPADTTMFTTCQKVSGHAFDPADPSYAVKVTISFSRGGVALGPDLTTNASTSGNHLYQLDTPGYVQTSTQALQVSAVGTAKNGSTFTLTNSPITIGPCLSAQGTCGQMTVSPETLDPNMPFTVTTAIRYDDLTTAQAVRDQPDFRYFISINGPGGYSFIDNNVAASQPDPSTFIITGSVSRPATNITGTFTIGWGAVGTFGSVNCGGAISGNPTPPVVKVTNMPFFKVTGGDITAGSGMDINGVGCTAGGVAANTNAGIVGWNRDAANNYAGAGTQYGAIALGHLQAFATGQGSAYMPQGVSIANTGGDSDQVNTGKQLYGGEMGSLPCIQDYFNGVSGALSGDKLLSDLLGVAPGGTYTVPDGTHKVLYVDGNVLVDVNVIYDGDYATANDIPSFALIVKRNIYVDKNVTQLDGIYVAQPDSAASTNGVLYTCAPSGFNTTAANVLAATLSADCSKKLVINGAVVARQVWLLRTYGTLGNNRAAETINYTPEVWMTSPFSSTTNPASVEDYNAITSLPPTL